MTTATPQVLHPELDALRLKSLQIGGAAIAATLVLAIIFPRAALPAYLVAFLFWLGISIGGIGFTMLHYLVGGAWGLPVRRPLEAAALNVIPLAVLALPILLGATYLYPWTDYAHLDEILRHKQPYLNLPFFVMRAIFYFVVWAVLALLLNRWSRQQDHMTYPGPYKKAQLMSGPGLVALFLTATFAIVDWSMSLEPHWYSSLYGPFVIVGWGLATFAIMILIVLGLSRYHVVEAAASADRIHDVGKLMFAFVLLWAYMGFMQFLIMWSGNLTEEIPWYLRRTRGGWQLVAILLMVFQFFFPFFILLSREVKRNITTLAAVSAIILVMRIVDLSWLVLPATNDPAKPFFPWLSALLVPLAVTGVGGVWLGCFLHTLRNMPLVPEHDPGIPVALEHAGAH